MFVIGHVNDELKYYHPDEGWVLIEEAEIYDDEDMQNTKLPEFGYWCTLWSMDLVQFARLITQCVKLGIINQQTGDQLAESMNCQWEEVASIVYRAVNRHNDFCKRLDEKYEEKDYELE